jgi:plastocyanin
MRISRDVSVGTTILSLLLFLACHDNSQTIRIVAQDFRFTPAEIRLDAARPIRLIVVNEGREPHEFESPLLAHRVGAFDPGNRTAMSLRVLPNQQAEATIQTVAGTYLFYCRIRGQTGMNGTIIVE